MRGRARELVHDATCALVAEERAWNPERASLLGFLIGVMRSRHDSRRKAERRRSARSDPDLVFDVASLPDEALLAMEEDRELRHILERAAPEPELRSLWEAVLSGAVRRAELAGELGWDADRVTAARIKLQRRLSAIGFRADKHARDAGYA